MQSTRMKNVTTTVVPHASLPESSRAPEAETLAALDRSQMWVEGQYHSRAADCSGLLAQFCQKRLVAAVDAVEVADGQRAMLENCWCRSFPIKRFARHACIYPFARLT